MEGALTFLFSDVEDSTGLLAEVGEQQFADLLDDQAEALQRPAEQWGGRLVDRQGDGCFFVFGRPSDAIRAAEAAQRALDSMPYRLRIGIHTGEASAIGDRFVGVAVHRASRICSVARGGETLVSATARHIAIDALPPDIALVEHGEVDLKGVGGERLYRLEVAARRPLPARSYDLRVGDADRERVASVLREHTVEGRLTLEEYVERLDEVFSSASDRELAATLRELPERPSEPVPRKRRSWLVTLLGSVQRRGRWAAPRRIFAFSFLGAPDFDFRQASVGDDVRITSISLIGVVTAIVPAGIDVEVGGLALIGGNDVYGEGGAMPVRTGPRVEIRSYALLGGARVTCLPPSGEEKAALAPPTPE
ncbi:MAG TPA: DUF1707 domain-containing protein [Gaiellaceae bacterium]|nr:DUF1707 domain-containing protein [Gaiellaceae bacterium]